MITTEDINKIRQQVTAKQINKGKITTDTIEGIRQQLAQRQAAQQPPIEQPVVQQPVQPTISQPNFANHASMSQQGHNNIAQKQATIDNNITKPMTSYLQNGGKIDINDTTSLAQLAREQGVQDTNYLQGRQEALNQPKLQDQYRVLPGSTTSVKIPQRTVSNVDSYDTRYGTQEANDTIKNIKITNDNQNADVYMNAKAGLQEAQQNNDLRGIARNQAIIDAYKDKYKETYKGDEKTTNFTNLNNKLINYRQNIDKAQERFLNADEEHKTRYAKELQEAIDVFNRTLKIYQEAIAYDEVMNDNMLKDIGSSTKLGFLGGTAKIENGLYQLGTREAGLNADTIDVNGLLDYNSGANYNILDTAGTLLNIGNPIKRAIPTLPGGKQSATQAINQLALIATTYPQIIKARDLYTKIATHTYEGTAEDLKKELDQIQKQIYQDFKDRFTQNTLNKEAEQLEHNRNVYGKFDFVPNAFNTTANMIPSMLLAPAGGETVSLGAMAIGAGSQASDQALAEGANYGQAFDYGVLSGLTEYGTEKIGGNNVNRLFGIGEKSLLNKLTGKGIKSLGIENRLAKAVFNTIGDVGGEVTEEAISEAINPLWKYLTYDKNAIPKDFGTYIKQVMDAGIEAIPSTLLMEGMGGAAHITKVNQMERGIIKSINESDLSPIVKNQLVNEVRKASRDVKLGLEENEYMQDKAYEKYANLSAQSEQMKQRIPEGYSLPQSTIDILSYTENNRPGLTIAFDNTIKGNGNFVDNGDGTRTITLNPNSKRAVEFTLTHELGHDLKGTAEYEQLQNLLIDYAKGKPNYQQSLNALDKTYKESGANYNLQDEATNDMLGQAIGEQEFYNKLAENPTLFNRVTNELKNLLGDKDTKLKNKIEKLTRNALKQEYRGKQEGTQQSLSETENDKTLAATHSLTEEKLRGILELGGFPVPSIAVSKPDIYRGENYGDATVFFNKDTIDPANKENEIYSRDIYSPRFPKIEYKINKDTRNAIQKEIVDIAGGYDNLNKNPYLHEAHLDMYDQNLSERLNSFGGQEKFINALSENHRYAYKYWFLKETQPDFIDVLDENGKIDTDKTNEKIDATINQDEYESWLRNKFANIVEKRGLRNNKDYYTNTGTPRSFEALHEDYTLDNVVKIMKALNTTGSESFFMKGFNEVAGTAAKKFNSIQDIKNSQDLLQNVSEENYKELLEPISNRLRDIETDIISKRDEQGLVSNYFIAMDSLGDTIQKVARKSNQKSKLTPSKVIDIMKKDYYDIDTETAQRIIDVIYDMKNLPTQYFESKPQRAVGFDEVNTMLIPNTWSDDTKQQLRDRGINYVEYDPTIEGDREAKYKEAAQDVLFSKSNGTWQQFLEDTYGKWNTGTKTNFEGLPSNEKLQRAENKGVNAILKDLKIPTNEELQKTERESVKKEPIVQANKITTDTALEDIRDFKEVGNRKVNAYQYDNPEVKPFFQQEAKNMLYDLNNAIKGERTATWDDYGELHYSGVTRETVQDIADLLDGKNGVKLSYADIEKGLNAIIEDKGSENIAAAKRIEMVLDKRLREGYTDSYGTEYEPNDNYLNFLAGKNFIDPAEYDKQIQDKLIADYEAENDDDTLFSLSEEEAKEVSDYVDKIYEDNTLDEDFRNKIIQEINKLANYDVFKDIKQEVKEYKEKNYGSISEPTQPKPKTVKWTETAQKNELVRENVEEQKITYVPSSNKQQLAHANKQLEQMGYDDAKKYLDNKVRYNERITPTDIALGERLIQEAIKKGDINQAQELIADTAILGKDYGQVIQALSMISRMTPEGQLMYINKVVDRLNDKIDTKNEKRSENKKANNIEIDKELAGNILKATNEVELQNAVDAVLQNIADQMEVSLPDKIAEWRYLAMLANPRTHIRNSVANVGMKGLYGAKNQIQRAIETVAAPLLDERTRTYKKATEDVKKFAEQSTKDLADILGGNDNKTIESRIKEMRKVFKNESLEKIRRFNSNMLSLEDNVFTQAAYKANLQEYLTANGIKTQHDIDMNPEIVQKGINFAKEEAWKTTFHQMSKAATAINRFENINGYTKLFAGGVIPFKKTPINIAKTGAAYSPLGLLDTLSTQTYKLKSGQITANQYIDRLSQGLTGSALFGIGALLAKMGILRAGTDKDDEYAEQIGQTKSYSVRLGDKNYDISWFAPSAMPLLMGAELVETTEGKETTFDDIAETLASTINPLSEMSFISSLNSAMRSYGSSDSSVDKIAAFLKSAGKSYFGQFVPTIGGQINKIIDKTERSTTATKDSPWKEGESFARQQINKIPGGSFLLEPKTDVWGNEKKRDSNVAVRAFDALINPGTVTKDQTTRVDKEIMELAKEADDTSIKPSIPKSYFTYNKEDVNLSAKDYTKYKKIYGQYMYNTYDALLDDEYYKSLEPAEKVKVLKNIATDSRNIAKNEVGYQTNEYFKYDAITDELEKNGIPLVDYYLIGRDIKMSDSKTKKKTAIAQTSESMNSKDKDRITSQDKKVLWDIFGIN